MINELTRTVSRNSTTQRDVTRGGRNALRAQLSRLHMFVVAGLGWPAGSAQLVVVTAPFAPVALAVVRLPSTSKV